ncbi:MAG: alanine--glyoxylate aminotransferase family protein [Chloroflexota bacterium]|nr:alanine--glyoxylate aminotransferase family protein [Chloroflexota bacterium]
MIPGPINFDPGVLREMSAPTAGHTAPEFVARFGEALDWLKQVFRAPGGTPFVVAGSGTLAMDMAVCNVVEPSDRALVVSTGYFSDRMATILERYGAQVTVLRAEVGDVVALDRVEAELARVKPKVLTMTHVDTSTGVAVDVRALALAGRKHNALVVVDGVCSVAGMELQQDAWGIDIALTASQKAIGVPPGLALLVASPRALEAFRARKTLVANYYGDWANWLPIMEAYLARKVAYFGTPPVNLVYALHESLRQILAEGLEARVARHTRISDAFKTGAQAIGLKQVPARAEIAATTMSALYYPDGVDAKMLGKVRERGVVLAGGLHPATRDKYFRVGHMGVVSHADISATLSAIEGALLASRYEFDEGAGLAALEKALA